MNGIQLSQVVIDAADPGRLAGFWGAALGWPVTPDGDEVVVDPPADAAGCPLVFVPVADPKAGKNRVHLDLRSGSREEQAAVVERLCGLGARPADIGQDGVPWVVLADPEDNEFCVLEPREQYAGYGQVVAVVIDAADPGRLAGFWAEATGWPPASSAEVFASLRNPAERGPDLEFLRSDEPRRGKNRLHLDLAPTRERDQAAEVERLQGLGAVTRDVGQRNVSWVVLADPEDNEFCVLTPR
ncbi:hypothetical protein GCM10012275_24180 [Longimycelium tulufanense]|uniref:Glyoxalase-like domain-containing protein n=1 Tax=Longimycelium tulufanense TaxID=907463 RepID=A0A8J3CE39_9PSEU|nr:VOC family protein [Longimycelium tulufanense]GGM52393.1 hypothetical protein GCM10012275_24180 [Longimycelium tulufanense]